MIGAKMSQETHILTEGAYLEDFRQLVAKCRLLSDFPSMQVIRFRAEKAALSTDY